MLLGLIRPHRRHGHPGRRGHHRLVHRAAPRARHRLHPRGPAPAGAAARARPSGRTAILGHQGQHALFRARLPATAGSRGTTPRGSCASTTSVRPGPDDAGRRPVGRQPAEAHHRPRAGVRRPSVLIAAHPTRGVDVGAQAAIWDRIRDARSDGLAMLLISADLEELIGLSDTLYVILRGPSGRQAGPGHRHPGGPRVLHDRRSRARRRRTGRRTRHQHLPTHPKGTPA